MESSRQEYWSEQPFPSPVDDILSELSAMTCLAYGCPGVSRKVVGWWWPTAGLGAWTVAIHAWDLLREVTIIFIASTIVWKWKWNWSHSVSSNSLLPHGLLPARLLHPWDFPGKNTGVGFHFLLQRSSQLRDQTLVPHTAGRLFTIWATREAHHSLAPGK